MPISPNGFRVGRLTNEEKDLIELNSHLSPEKIAAKINREISTVKKYLAKIGKAKTKTGIQLTAELALKETPYWDEIQRQFSPKELIVFLHHYKEICQQMGNDYTKTEHISIIDVAKLEILISRNLIQQQKLSEQIADLEEEISQLQREGGDKERIYELQRQLPIYFQSRVSLSAEYKELFNKKESTIKILKGTRDQRLNKIESSNTTFKGLLQKIISDPSISERYSIEMEKFRLAVEKERERLSDYHTYINGEVDQPLLSASTIIKD